MPHYHNFIGIDIGKFNFVVSVLGQKDTKEYENTMSDIAQFITDYKSILPDGLTVLETTGGYELELLYTLCQHHFPVHRADTRKVKNFIKSFGNSAKTDALDSKALANYGKERAERLELFSPQSKQAINLFHLVQRRADLTKIVVAEKNRLKSPSYEIVEESCKILIATCSAQVELITQQIKELIASDPILKEKLKILKTIPGIGDVVAFNLLILLPELGYLNRKKIASLAGLAPQANESGRFKGYRRTGYGRNGIKPLLFMAAMAARNSKSHLKEFYERLLANGKKKMVVLTALMRKILIIANARLKELAYAKT